MTSHLLTRALAGEPLPTTARGRALWLCRHYRAVRAWLTVGSYGWLRHTDDLRRAQRALLDLRRSR